MLCDDQLMTVFGQYAVLFNRMFNSLYFSLPIICQRSAKMNGMCTLRSVRCLHLHSFVVLMVSMEAVLRFLQPFGLLIAFLSAVL